MNSTSKDLTIILIVGSFLFWIIWCGIHGFYMDNVEGRMHDDCVKCNTYRMLHSRDVAFQIREMNRK